MGAGEMTDGGSVGTVTVEGENKPKNDEECVPIHGQTDADKLAYSLIWRIAAAAAAAAQAAMAAYISAKQYEIAKMLLSIAQYWRDWYNTAFVPLENKELDELYALKDIVPHYDVAIGRGKATVRFVMKSALNRTMKCAAQYDTGIRNRILKEMLVTEASAVAHGAAAGYRFERDRVDKLISSRWQKYLGAVNRGREIAAASVDYGNLAAHIYGSLGNMAAEASGGFMELAGYMGSRRRTRYNKDYGARGGYEQVKGFMETFTPFITGQGDGSGTV
jgi:hypothetical protein